MENFIDEKILFKIISIAMDAKEESMAKKYYSDSIAAKILFVHYSKDGMNKIMSYLKISRRLFFYYRKKFYIRMKYDKEFRFYNSCINEIMINIGFIGGKQTCVSVLNGNPIVIYSKIDYKQEGSTITILPKSRSYPYSISISKKKEDE